jgi:F-type H+/Na+-transporting ATPase subunit beta
MARTAAPESRRQDGGPVADRRGEVVSISGSVVDMTFAEGELPRLFNAIEIEWDSPYRLIVEVHQHIDPRRVRGDPIDQGPRFGADVPRLPIHRAPPELAAQKCAFHTVRDV